jgi:hypothetical protein
LQWSELCVQLQYAYPSEVEHYHPDCGSRDNARCRATNQTALFVAMLQVALAMAAMAAMAAWQHPSPCERVLHAL